MRISLRGCRPPFATRREIQPVSARPRDADRKAPFAMIRMPRVVVIGSINMDFVVSTPILPAPGETVLGSAFSTTPGGKGGNQAIAASRAGGEVTMIGALGSDGPARQLECALAEAGVATGLVRRVDGSSGVAFITVDGAAENSIVVIPGANHTLQALSDADRAAIEHADIVVAQLEIPLSTVVEAAEVAAAAGVAFLLNPSPVRPLPDALLSRVSVLVANEGEMRALGHDVVRALSHVVCTLGAAGARYRGLDGPEITVVPPPVEPVDTSGAGDAFTGAFAVAWAAGSGPEDALRLACAAGALATTRFGAAASSPTAAEIDRALS